jgi:O-antigen/teichoic acid export membrane protein
VGKQFVPYAWMLQLFLVATLPLMLSVITQMGIGMGKIKVVAISSMVGALVNLPLSYELTRRWGVSGVIWGTVLTTLISNWLVPALYLFRALEIRRATFFARSLSAPMAGALALIAASWACRWAISPEPGSATGPARSVPLLVNLTVGSLAYILGYIATPTGRGDLAAIRRKFFGGPAPAEEDGRV